MTDLRDARLGTAYEVELPAGTLRYHAAGDGPPIVFVHGYLVNANLWRKVVPLLSGQSGASRRTGRWGLIRCR
jgi:pimeloyl-ACP methyl ester carboxylesterase